MTSGRSSDNPRWSSDAGVDTPGATGSSTPDPRWSSDGPRWSSDAGDETPGAATGATRGAQWPDVLIVVGLTLVAALAAALGFFHLAWRWGTVPVPVSPIVLAVIVWVLCRASFRLTGSLLKAALPWVGCLVVIVILYFGKNPGFSLPLRVVTMNYETNQAADGDWRGLLLLGVLVLSSAVQLSLLWAASVSAAATRAMAPAAGPAADHGVPSRPSDPSDAAEHPGPRSE